MRYVPLNEHNAGACCLIVLTGEALLQSMTTPQRAMSTGVPNVLNLPE